MKTIILCSAVFCSALFVGWQLANEKPISPIASRVVPSERSKPFAPSPITVFSPLENPVVAPEVPYHIQWDQLATASEVQPLINEMPNLSAEPLSHSIATIARCADGSTVMDLVQLARDHPVSADGVTLGLSSIRNATAIPALGEVIVSQPKTELASASVHALLKMQTAESWAELEVAAALLADQGDVRLTEQLRRIGPPVSNVSLAPAELPEH